MEKQYLLMQISLYCRKDISADTLFSRLGDFAVSRILIFADAGTEHSTSTLLFYCRNEKTAVSISLVIDYKSNSCIPFRNTGEVLKSLLCVVCVLKVHATSSSDTARHIVLVERWINSLSSDRCQILKMNSFFFRFFENNMSAEISCFTVHRSGGVPGVSKLLHILHPSTVLFWVK